MSASALYQGYTRIDDDTSVTWTCNRWTCSRYYSLRIFRSRWALLVLVWYLFIFLTDVNTSRVFNILSSFTTSAYSQLLFSGIIAFTGALCPVFGYLADAHFGRYKVIVALSITLTIGQLYGGVQIILKDLHYYTLQPIVALFLLLPSFILSRVGMDSAGSFMVIFGMDQLKDASSDELASYIYWCVWVEMLGTATLGTINIFMSKYKHYMLANGLLSGFMALVFWVFLWLNNRFASGRYYREPLSSGSYKQTLRVLKFAAEHKYPLQRSAWTYCEDEKISRIDLGKSRYGGPFTTEQVEDVKTLLWILLIIGISCVASLPLQAQFDNFVSSRFQMHMNWIKRTEASDIAHMAATVVGVLAITFHELVIFPLARRWFPSILKRLGLLLLLFLVTPFSYMIIDNAYRGNPNACMFQNEITNGTVFPNSTAVVSQYSVLFPTVVSGVAYTLFHCTLLELIIAQSPEHFKSMLVGLMVALTELRYLMFQVFSLPISRFYSSRLPFQSSDDFSCDNVFYIVLVAIAFIGLLLYCMASRKYTYRRRDDVTINEHMYAEEYYSQGSM